MIRKKNIPKLSPTELLEVALRMGEAMATEDVPYAQILVFLYVAANAGSEGVEIRQVAADLGLSSAAASRHVSALSDWSWRQKPGAGLIEARIDLTDRRRRFLFLTPKGEKALKSIS